MPFAVMKAGVLYYMAYDQLMLRQIVIPMKVGIRNNLILLNSGFFRNDGSPR